MGAARLLVHSSRAAVRPSATASASGPACSSSESTATACSSRSASGSTRKAGWPCPAMTTRGPRTSLRTAPGFRCCCAAASRLSSSCPASTRWTVRPDALAVPASVGFVRLTIDGRSVGAPERVGGNVRLGATRPVTEANQLDVQVHRKLTDSLPGTLRTRILLRVAGEPRETAIGPLLPDGFTPLQLKGELPARLDSDGRLRVQLRAGSWWR